MILLVHGDREYLAAPGEEFHTDLGVVEVPADVAGGDTVESHLGEEFCARELRGPDFARHFERSGAPMLPKDVGLVVGHTGAGAGDRVLDAGTGTGVLAAYLGNLGAEVLTVERDPEFAEVARENMQMANVADAVEVRTGDVTEELPGLGRFDLVTLDTEDAPSVVADAPAHLTDGGYVAVYSPFVESAREAATAAADAGLDATTYETIQREMEFDERGTRPTTTGVGHTGYLTVARKT